MNHYKKPTQEKLPVEIMILQGTNDLSSNKEPMDIANIIQQLAKSVKTNTNKVADKFNIKKKINTHLQDYILQKNFPLITQNNINSHHHINVKGLHLNSYGDKQLNRNFINFIGNGYQNFGISLNNSQPQLTDATTHRDELNNSFSVDAILNN